MDDYRSAIESAVRLEGALAKAIASGPLAKSAAAEPLAELRESIADLRKRFENLEAWADHFRRFPCAPQKLQ